jgi:predicted  nucleic acid-binding Zn-ribbon protein
MSAQAKQYKIIQREFEDLKRDFAQTDNQKNEMIRTLQEDNEIAAREIKGLNDKIVEVMRASAEKYEAELAAHFDSKNKIKLLESKLQEIQYELDDSNHKLMLSGQSSEELSNYINDLKFKLSGKENDIRALAKEKGDLRNKIDTYLLQIGEMKKNFQVYLMAKMREIRIELRDLKNY